MNISKPLTWNELADLYPGTARIKPMQEVFDYFKRQADNFFVCPKEGTIHKILDKEKS